VYLCRYRNAEGNGVKDVSADRLEFKGRSGVVGIGRGGSAAHGYHVLTQRVARGMQTLPHASAHISSATQTAALPQSFARLESS